MTLPIDTQRDDTAGRMIEINESFTNPQKYVVKNILDNPDAVSQLNEITGIQENDILDGAIQDGFSLDCAPNEESLSLSRLGGGSTTRNNQASKTIPRGLSTPKPLKTG